jgi:hypothetical protein
VAAVVWGIGLSVYGFQQPPGQLSWVAWGVQLIAGILGCVVTPLLFVRWREWVLARLQATDAHPRNPRLLEQR